MWPVADGYMTATMAGLRAALIADATIGPMLPGGVVDEPQSDIAFPYVRFGNLEVVEDDTDGTLGAIVQVGLEVHSRPVAGRTEAAQICETLATALHRNAIAVWIVEYLITDILVQTWTVDRAKDGASYEGRIALEVHLDA